MKTPRDMTHNDFKEALRRHRFIHLQYPNSQSYRLILRDGTWAGICLKIRTAPTRRAIIKALLDYRDHLEGLPLHPLPSENGDTPPDPKIS